MSVSSRYDIPQSVYDSPLDQRLAFLRRTYLHLTGAVLAFIVISTVLQLLGVGELMARMVMRSGYTWLAVLGAFSLLGWMSTALTQSSRPLSTQYGGLALYTFAQAIIFAPMLFIASVIDASIIPTAAGLTILTFGGLSIYVLTTRKDFSFLGVGLCVAGFVALGVIIAGVIFGFNLGVWFSGAMILLAMGSILYSTSNALHNYSTDQYVAAALELFSAVALLFWYVLRLLMQLRR
jgi:FtsH-binding integral membrane protein